MHGLVGVLGSVARSTQYRELPVLLTPRCPTGAVAEVVRSRMTVRQFVLRDDLPAGVTKNRRTHDASIARLREGVKRNLGEGRPTVQDCAIGQSC